MLKVFMCHITDMKRRGYTYYFDNSNINIYYSDITW